MFLKYFHYFCKDAGAGCQKVIMVFTDGPTERAEAVFEKYNSEKEVWLQNRLNNHNSLL